MPSFHYIGRKVDGGKPRARSTLAPFMFFIALAGFFAVALFSGDPHKLPSALIGKQVPTVNFAALDGLADAKGPVAGFSGADLAKGQVTVVNFWASWCAPCVEEHPVLTELAKLGGVPVFAVNYKDQPENSLRFLGRYGNPFARLGSDPTGRGAIEWGVYGMPETFVVNGKGEIIYKHVGPMTLESVATKIMPAIEKARSVAAR